MIKLKKLILKEFKTYDDFMEFVKTFSRSTFETVQPKTTKELKQLIKDTIKKEGNEADLNFIDTSLITDMTDLFVGMFNFNGKIDKWDTSKVTNMNYMFCNAKSFNQPIDKWDVSKVTSMLSMFDGCPAKTPKWYKEEK